MNKIIPENINEFVKFGFSKQEATVYLLIFRSGSISTKDIAQQLKVSPNSLYRILEKLNQKKLVSSVNDWPKTYKAIPPRLAFDLLAENKIIEIEESKEKLINLLPISSSNNDQTKIEVIGGTKELFNSYVNLSKKTKKEIYIISVGEEVSDEVLLVNRDSLERGVKIYFIVHKFDQSNKDLLVRWQRMGIEVRHLSGQGFHLVIFDQNQTLLSASNPKNLKDRSTVHISSPEISKALAQYFNSIWKIAVPIS